MKINKLLKFNQEIIHNLIEINIHKIKKFN